VHPAPWNSKPISQEALQGRIGLPLQRGGLQLNQHRPIPLAQHGIAAAAGLDAELQELVSHGGAGEDSMADVVLNAEPMVGPDARH
jgi:hypothetical protein